MFLVFLFFSSVKILVCALYCISIVGHSQAGSVAARWALFGRHLQLQSP